MGYLDLMLNHVLLWQLPKKLAYGLVALFGAGCSSMLNSNPRRADEAARGVQGHYIINQST